MNLLPHQNIAADFLAERKSALLADGMRVGKTPAAIGGCDRIDAKDVLWLTRGAARAEHAKAWANFQTIDRPITVLESLKHKPARGVNIVSYDLAAGSVRDKLLRPWRQNEKPGKPWDVIVLDESHRLKTRDIKRTAFVFGEACDGVDSLIEKGERVWCLSGTPAPNHPAELWPMLRALFPDAIPQPQKPTSYLRYWDFVFKYCRTQPGGFGETDVKILGGKNLAELKAAMAPVTLRRRIEEVMPDVPSITIDTLPLSTKFFLPAGSDHEIRKVCEALDAGGIDALGELGEQASTLRRLLAFAKVQPIVEWVSEKLEDNDEKIVLFAHHTDVIEMLRGRLRNFNPVALYGKSSDTEKREAAPRFRNDPTCRVFIGNLATAGEAIDLSVADELVFVESSWVPGENDQAALRIVNIMKKRPTLALFAYLPGSIDERIQDACAAKAKTIAEMFS